MATGASVGNAMLYIGLPYHKRKSYARDSAGFEPIEAYFPPHRYLDPQSGTDSDSSDTDIEEEMRLIKEERARKRAEANARRKAALSAKQKAERNRATQENTTKQQHQQRENEAPPPTTAVKQKSLLHSNTRQERSQPKSIPSASHIQQGSENEVLLTSVNDATTGEVVPLPPGVQSDEGGFSDPHVLPNGVPGSGGDDHVVVLEDRDTEGVGREGGNDSERLYSPRNTTHTILTPVGPEGPAQHTRLLPSRLTFSVDASSTDEESHKDTDGGAESATSDTPKSSKTRRKSRKSSTTKKRNASRKQQKSATATQSILAAAKAISVRDSIPSLGGGGDSDPVPDIGGETEVLGGSSDLPGAVATTADTISLSNNDEMVFNPPTNSTQLSDPTTTTSRSSRSRKTKAAVRKISSIPTTSSQMQHFTDTESDVSSDTEQSLNVLLKGVSPFKGLSHLAQLRASKSTSTAESSKTLPLKRAKSTDKKTTSKSTAKKSVSKKSISKKTNAHEDGDDDGSATPLREKSTKDKKSTKNNKRQKSLAEKRELRERVAKRKSVTFQSDQTSPITSSSEHEMRSSKSEKSRRKSKEVRSTNPTDRSSSLEQSPSPATASPPTASTPSSSPWSGTKTKSATKRRSILKNVSVCRVTSPWFVPPDPSNISKRRTSESSVEAEGSLRRSRRSSASKLTPSTTRTTTSLTPVSDMRESVFDAEPMDQGVEFPIEDDESIAANNTPPEAPSHTYSKRGGNMSDTDSLLGSAGSKRTRGGNMSDTDSLLGSAGSKQTRGASSVSKDQSIDVSVLPKIKKRKRTRVTAGPPRKRKPKAKSLTPLPVSEYDDDGTESEASHNDPHVYSFSSGDEEGGGLEFTKTPGGRTYRRLRVQGVAARRTPGVRRSQRTRVAPVKHWLNEQVEYNMRRRSGISLKGVLVPVAVDHEGSPPRPSKIKKKGGATQMQGDEDYPPLRMTDKEGNVTETPIVKTLGSAEKLNSKGEPVNSESDVVVSQLVNCGNSASVGHLSFDSYGGKPKSVSTKYELVFYVIKGDLLFRINDQEFSVQKDTSIQVPAESLYEVHNMKRSKAEVLYVTILK